MWVIISKFREGAWMVVLLIPILVIMFLDIHRHYVNAAKQLSLEGLSPPMPLRNTVVVPVSSLHRGVVSALAYANAIAPGNVTAVHVSLDDEQTAKLKRKWEHWGQDIPLVVIDSPYRSLVRPLMRYLTSVRDKRRQVRASAAIHRRFGWLVAIRDQSGHQIDGKVGDAAVARMFNLQHMLELVKHGFQQRTAAEQKLVV